MNYKYPLHYERATGDVSEETFQALATECRRRHIDPVRDLMLTNVRDGDPATRYRCWVRKNGWGMRLGRHASTVQAAAESLLAKLAKEPA